MKLNKIGEYRTRQGKTVLVWGFKPEFIAPDSYTVYGSLLMDNGEWNDLTWTEEGHFTVLRNSDEIENDIVEYVCPIGEGLH